MASDNISRLVLDVMDDAVYVASLDTYELYYLNQRALDILQNPPEEQWLHKKCYQILQGRNEPCTFCTNKYLTNESFYHWSFYNTHLDRHFWNQDRLINFEGVPARLEIARDVTDQNMLAENLKEQIEEQRIINDCIGLLYAQKTPEEAINELLSRIANYYQAERGYIFMRSKDQKMISNTHEWCKEGVSAQLDFLQDVDASIVAHWFAKYEEVGEFYIDSIHEELDPDSEEYRILKSQEIDSLVTAPLRNTKMEVVGFIGVDNPKRYIKNTSLIRSVSAFITDFLEKSDLIEKLNQLSFYDNLTGLKNRHSYSMALKQGPNQRSVGVIYVDINGLKIVNDQQGHQMGDAYILSVSDVLKDTFGQNAYRIGGDEFVVICINEPQRSFLQSVAFLRQTFNSGETPKASIGCSWSDQENIIEQVERADHAMYEEKQWHHQQKYCTQGLQTNQAEHKRCENCPERRKHQ